MNSNFSNIKVIIWDVDSTLYKPTPELHNAIRQAEITVVQKHNTWSYQKAEAEFYRIYKVFTPSGTATAAKLTGIPVAQAAAEMEKLILNAKEKHLHVDDRLIELFRKLGSFQHYILSNGTQIGVKKTLEQIGLKTEIFKEIVTSELTGENKPGFKGYEYIMSKTKLKPDLHLMVGDRDLVDIFPAKKIGMKTCYVWGESIVADISIPDVYGLANILIPV